MAGNKMLIIVTTGPEDRGNRATLAFSMGVAALISGVDTTIYLTMGGTFWSRAKAGEKVHIDGFEPLQVYIREFLDSGGKLMVCSPCAQFYCSIADQAPLLEGAQLCGLTHIVDVALDASTITL
jgi:predicted peroxiredoxin